MNVFQSKYSISRNKEDILAKLEKFQKKLTDRQNLTPSVASQNAFVNESINELEQLNPAFKQLQREALSDNNSNGNQIQQTVDQLTELKAILKRTVSK